MQRLRLISRLPVRGQDTDPEVKIRFLVGLLELVQPLIQDKDQGNSTG